jgi:hypothetical protein
LNLAPTARACETVVVQVGLIPLQAPDQPAKTEPGAGAAVSVTCVPAVKVAVQAVPQSMPVGAEVTTPTPAPFRVTVSRWATSLRVLTIVQEATESTTAWQSVTSAE